MYNRDLSLTCLLAVWHLAYCPAQAQDYMRQNLDQKMRAADAAFQRNDYETGANIIREVCYSLKSSQQADANPVQIASRKSRSNRQQITKRHCQQRLRIGEATDQSRGDIAQSA